MRSMPFANALRRPITGLAWMLLVGGSPAYSADLLVTVLGASSAEGALGCALFAEAAASQFPFELSRAVTQRSPATAGTMQCVFRSVAAGAYAVSAVHDVNGNGEVDRNFVGQPSEPWAVSNNVRPALRAPRFAEAAITLGADESRSIELRLKR